MKPLPHSKSLVSEDRRLCLPPMNLMRLPLTLLTLLLVSPFLCSQLRAQFPTIELSSLSQAVLQRGKTTRISVVGKNTHELRELLFTHPDLTAKAEMTVKSFPMDEPETTGQFDVTVPASVPCGRYEVRALGRFGVSNPRRLVVVDKPVHRMPAAHYSTTSAATVSDEEIISGHFIARSRVYFRITLQENQTFRCMLLTKGMDSRAIASVALFSPQRKKLAQARGLGDWPAELALTADEAGEYTLVANDFLFRGGSEFSYAMEISVSSGADQGGAGMLFSRWPIRPDSLDVVPDDVGSLRTAPFTVAGNFASKKNTFFDFQASKGQLFRLDIDSHSLGQLTDPRLYIYEIHETKAENGTSVESLQFLADRDDEPTIGSSEVKIVQKDPSLAWKAPRDGDYRIEVRDNEQGKRPVNAQQFMLQTSAPKPSFSLVAYRPFPTNNPATARQIGSNLQRGGTEAVRILALRKHGFSGAIEVSVDGLPKGVTCEPTIVAPGTTEASLVFVAREDALPWCGELTITGEDFAKDLSAQSTIATVCWPANSDFNSVISRPTEKILLGVNADETAPVFATLGTSEIIEVAQGSTAKIQIKLVRREGGKQSCLFRAKHLPPKTTFADTTIAADKTEATVEFKVAGDAPPGEYSFELQNETKVKWRSNPQALTRAQQRLEILNQLLKETQEVDARERFESYAKSTQESIESLKKTTAAKDITVWIPSTTARIRIVPKSN